MIKKCPTTSWLTQFSRYLCQLEFHTVHIYVCTYIHEYMYIYRVYLDTAVGTLQDLTICQRSGKLTCGWAPIVVTAAASPFPFAPSLSRSPPLPPAVPF